MQPYRLEMGTRLQTPKGKNLYEFWGTQIAEYLNEQLDQAHDESVIINLASVEYFKSVDRKTLKAPVVECVFQDERDRKSTRLNSSHVAISYAVFCLKKKKVYQKLDDGLLYTHLFKQL